GGAGTRRRPGRDSGRRVRGYPRGRAKSRSARVTTSSIEPSRLVYGQPGGSAVRAFAPGSVGNIGVGFDVLGHSFAGVRDIALVRRIEEPVVRIAAIRGTVTGAAELPMQAEKNTAGRALQALRGHLAIAHGFELELEKGIPL